MRRTSNFTESSEKITVDIQGLMQTLSVGRRTAEKIAAEAGAGLKIGRRRLYNLEKIKAYLNSLESA